MKRIAIFILVLYCTITSAISQDTLVLQPGPDGKDAYINDYYEGNFGDYPNLFAIAGTASGDPFFTRSLLEFDLSSIPPGTAIIEARLSLFFANNPDVPYYHYGENQAFLQRVIEPWEEYDVTWWNQPQSTGQNQVSLPASQYEAQDYTDIDVKDLIQDIINDPENSYGILLKLQVEEIYRRMFFASGDHENPLLWPKLEIIHMGCPIPTAGFEYLADSLNLSFTGISPTATSWHWDFGDGDTSNLQDPIHTYAQQGFYEVCLLVEDTCYFADHCEEIEICFAPPVAGFTYITEGLIVDFQDTSLVAEEFYWDFGDGYFSGLPNPTHTYEIIGTYDVCLTTWNSCGADTTCEILELCIPPVSAFAYDINDFTVYFEDNSIQAENYFWDFGDSYYSNLADPWHEYESPGNYHVCLTTWNDCGADTICQMLHLSTVNIDEHAEELITIYPNPARDEVFIKTNLSGTGTLSLLDLNGKEVLKQGINLYDPELIKLSLGHIHPGIYILRVCQGKENFFSKLAVIN